MSQAGAVFEVLPSPALLVNPRSQVIDVNAAAQRFLGCERKALLQRDVLEALIADEDKADVGVYLKEALDGAANEKSLKVTCVSRTGRKQVSLCAATLRTAGKLDGAIVTFQDMTEIRNMAGTTNTGGAEHLSGALSATGAALICIDTEGKILEWTPKMEKIAGISTGQAAGQDLTFCVADSFKSGMKKSLEQALRGVEVPRFTVEFNAGGGRIKEVLMSMAPWRSATGRIVGAISTFEDALETDRRVAEAEWVREACGEQLERANALIFSVDSNMCITAWNHRLADVTGQEKEATAGKKLLELISGTPKLAMDAAKAALQGEFAATAFQMTLLGVDMTCGFSPQFNFNGKVIGALAIGQQLPESVTAVSKTDPGQDAKGMALHELRSPLHGIIGLANTLSQEAGRLQKPLSMIGLSAERALNLATDIMDFSMYQAAELRTAETSKSELVDLAVVAKEWIKKSETMKDKRGRPLQKDKVNLETDIQEVSVEADSNAMQQILNQIMTNAFKFTTEGEVVLSIKKDKENESAIITVSDTGCGIKNENLQGVLQAKQDHRHGTNGMGLGLALVREVVRIHHGRCEIKPKEKGTIVTVTIPCQTPQAAAREVREVPAAQVTSTSKRGPPSSWLGPMAQLGIQVVPKAAMVNAGSRTATSLPSLKEGITTETPVSFEEDDNLIMSVDDDFVNQEVMRSILEPCGFKVVSCMNGTECLEYLDGENPQPRLLLLDLMMPGLSGFDVLQALQKKVSLMELPVVMVSAKNQSSSVVKGYELGCTDWIHKPFCRQELIARVKSHLKMRATLLSYRLSATHERSQENLPVMLEQEEVSLRAGSQALTEMGDSGPADSTALFAMVEAEASIESMAPLFQDFERLSEKYQAFRTEIIGSSYIAIAMGTGDETRHADKLLLLAHKLLETTRKASMTLRVGIDTETFVPSKLTRGYPQNSFFGATLQKAKQLSEAAAENRILLSRSARCRLSADVEAELQQSSLRLLEGDAGSDLGVHYFIAETNESDPKPLRDDKANAEKLENQMAVQAMQQELLQSKSNFAMLQKQLSTTQEQMLQAQSDASSLRTQLQVAQQTSAQARPSPEIPTFKQEKIPEISGPTTQSTSLLFLQWQNAHLQAEVRHYQTALSSTKAELQMQIMSSQLLESKHSLLQARVEHLELDLGFKAACESSGQLEGFDEPSGPVSPAHGGSLGVTPSVAAAPSAAAAPSLESPFGMNFPGIPGMPMSGLPGLAGGPGLPGVPNGMMGMPGMPGLSSGFSGMPQMSSLSMPGMSLLGGLGGPPGPG